MSDINKAEHQPVPVKETPVADKKEEQKAESPVAYVKDAQGNTVMVARGSKQHKKLLKLENEKTKK